MMTRIRETGRGWFLKMGSQMFSEQFIDRHDASTLAYAIIDTVCEPFVVLDEDLRVIAASRSFYRTFAVNPDNTQNKLLYELGDGEWISRICAHCSEGFF